MIPSAFPAATFQDNKGDINIFDSLDEIINLQLAPGRIIEDTKSWSKVIDGITNHFLTPLSAYHASQWSAYYERANLASRSVEIVKRASGCVESLGVGPEDFARKTITRLLNFCSGLDTWLDVEITEEDDMPSPSELRSRAFQAAVSLLRCIDTAPPKGSNEPPWKTLRVILQEFLDVCDDILTTPTLNFPFSISLFNKPRLSEVTDVSKLPSGNASETLIVQTPSQLALFLGLILNLICRSLHSPPPSQCFLVDLFRRATEATQRITDYCLSPSCATTSLMRARTLEEILSASYILISASTGFESAIRRLPSRLLRYALVQGPKPCWESVYVTLEQVMNAINTAPCTKTDVLAIVDILRVETWGDSGKSLRDLACSYIRWSVPHLDTVTVQAVKDMVPWFSLDGNQVELRGSAAAKKWEEISWRPRIKASMDEIMAPDVITWMDVDGVTTSDQYASRALDDIRERFMKPLRMSSASSRKGLADELAKLVCLFAHPETINCTRTSKLSMPFLAVYLPIITRLLDDTEDEITHGVRRAVYGALACVIKHSCCHHEGMDQAAELITQGLRVHDRAIRLSAGRVLAELFGIYVTLGTAKQQYEPLFEDLRRLLDASGDPIKETAIVAMGLLGKILSRDILGKVVFLLITQLASQNPVIKGGAYMQLMAIARHHKRTPYGLVSPYLHEIAPLVISRMCTHPSLLTETCNFLSKSPSDFISVTLPRTLPQLFAYCELKVLHEIAKDLDIKLSRLFLNHSHQILAHVFLLQGPGQTNRALAFIIKHLTEETGNKGTIDTRSIIHSCVVPLLVELVIVLGSDDRIQAEYAIQALNNVERAYFVPSRAQRNAPTPNVGNFLKAWMLGLISHINDILQDVQGKKSMATKRQIIRSLGALVTHVGSAISNVAPQIMATLQTMVGISGLAEVTLQTWNIFLATLRAPDVGPHVGPTSATFISLWPALSPQERETGKKCLDYIILGIGEGLGKYLDDVADLARFPELDGTQERLNKLREGWKPSYKLQCILERASSDNLTVSLQALRELKAFLHTEQKDFTRDLASGDIFDPLVGQILVTLFAAACRDGDGTDALRLLAFECIGVLGAVDPDRCDIGFHDENMVVRHNFTDEGESVQFALHLIRDVLVGTFRSTSDIRYQSHLAYAIQELLSFCKFTPALVAAGSNVSVPMKVRSRWNSLPKHVLETVAPLLESRYSLTMKPVVTQHHPIYPHQSTYREWIQLWTSHLITKASGDTARTIFGVCCSAARNKDVGVANYLLPHLVLNILISGLDEDVRNILSELLVVLKDQVNSESASTADKKLLSAQVVFVLLDHLNKWVRIVRQDISNKKIEGKRSRGALGHHSEEQLARVDSILSSIDQELMAKAALECKAYARSLMNFEQQIVALEASRSTTKDLPVYYERLHQIYAHLDEPDGMEGVSTLILSPSLEHQIRQHESTGRWTSAQSCWEVRLQQSPDNLDFHLGLLGCLRNLGHYDTLRTHVKGVLTRNPDWESALAGFQVESAWMVGAWADVQSLVDRTDAQTSPIVMARLLLAMRTGDRSAIADALSVARTVLGIPITASGVKGYRRSYDAVLDLHLTHELEMIYDVVTALPETSQGHSAIRRQMLTDLSQMLSARLDASLPTFRTREPILSMRRTAFALTPRPRSYITNEIGRSWLASAKIARKAGQWQTAYSAMLQAEQSSSHFSFMESAKLVKATGEPLRALQELGKSMRLLGLIEDPNDVIDLTEDDQESKRIKAKAQVLRARWMNESDRFEMTHILKTFQDATELCPKWESAHYHLGQFHDQCFKNLPSADRTNRGTRMNLYTVRFFSKAIKFGSKYVYQTIPRLLTIWLDMGENLASSEQFPKLNMVITKAIKETPVYKWFIAFPQIVSRVGHTNPDVYSNLSKLISLVIQEYPNQALWLFASVVKSTKRNRESRGREILRQLENNPSNIRTQVPMLIRQCLAMINELLGLCHHHIDDDSRKTLTMSKDFPRLSALGHSPLIIPLQESLTASLPPVSSSESLHQPFPPNAPTFDEFFDEIEIMRSLAKPRKITIRGNNGQVYMFLGKPKDDLRKDARLMDFNAIINKILKANSESRRRQLHIRTYGVVTLNEECGFIQWVPDTIPIRPILTKGYDARRVRNWSTEMNDVFKKIKDCSDKEGGQLFVDKILSMFPPVFHEWFIETFPEPSAWFASRLAYGRTAAVMSMVGFILGLGDRHCENILLDNNTGDVVHVDFNCLFEKGKTLETPERVPFRLTQNIVDGLGVTGVEGVFRIACEVTLQLLRDNKDSLMSVLDAFIHDPLVEWEDEKRKLEREPLRRNNVKASVDLHMLAKGALNQIQKKLKGIYSTSKEKHEREISTSNLVEMLIQEATNSANLAKMYTGWASWH